MSSLQMVSRVMYVALGFTWPQALSCVGISQGWHFWTDLAPHDRSNTTKRNHSYAPHHPNALLCWVVSIIDKCTSACGLALLWSNVTRGLCKLHTQVVYSHAPPCPALPMLSWKLRVKQSGHIASRLWSKAFQTNCRNMMSSPSLKSIVRVHQEWCSQLDSSSTSHRCKLL